MRWGPRLSARVDGASLAVFRAGFGAIVAWEVWRSFDGNQVRADYVFPPFHFRWWLFDWVRPLPDGLLYAVFVLTGIAAVCVALGRFYRVASIALFAGAAYWFLLEKAVYLNHHYLMVLFAGLLIFVRADRAVLPAWSLWLVRFQVGVPYFFAGVAKLNGDWLVRNEPLKTWMAAQTDFPLVGRFLVEPAFIRGMAYASTALDLFVVFLLLNRRARPWAYGAALGFHLLNMRLFDIGMFPPMMIVATTVFFEPDWPKRFWSMWRDGSGTRRAVLVGAASAGFLVGGFLPPTFVPVQALVGAFGVAVFAYAVLDRRTEATAVAKGPPVRRGVLVVLALWASVQLLVPLRHFVIPGNVHWTEEGQHFSWHMLLNSRLGTVAFRVTDPDADRTWIEPMGKYLTNYQMAKIARSPDLILTFAHHLADELRRQGHEHVEVRAISRLSLNGRPKQRMIDPKVDLAKVPRPYLPPADWIVPLKESG